MRFAVPARALLPERLRRSRALTDVNADLISNFTVCSASGFNYVSPVPEVETWALMGVGLISLIAVGKR